MLIIYVGPLQKVTNELLIKISSNISYDMMKKVYDIYEEKYLATQASKIVIDGPGVNIILMHNQPITF